MKWIIEPEYVSFIIIVILILNTSLFNKRALSFATRFFNVCLYISLISIFLNIITVFTIYYASYIPIWINNSLNTIFFIFIPLVSVSVAVYSLIIIYEHNPNKKGLEKAIALIFLVYILYLALLLTNPYTGFIFRFDEANNYNRGPLNSLVFFMCVYDIVVCVVNYIYYHKYTCGYFNRVIYIVSPIVILIGLLQVLSPNTMLSGTATAVTLLVIFINLQQERNNTDNLTGLINRDGFYEVITNYTKHHIPFRMVIVCIRGFKSINNHYGQKSADLFLKEIGSFINTLFSDAVVCRLSGVEYAVILAGVTEEGYKKCIDELIKRFNLPWVIQDIKCELSACFADAFFEEYTPRMEEITSFLEFSANLEKQYICGHIQHFNEEDKIQYIRRSHLVDLLDYSYKFDRFSLNFQPVYDCSTNDFSGVEALLRLKDTNGSLISPSEFIPLAEETGLIIDISWMVLNKVCCFLSENKDLPVDSISVNFSVQQFQDENMADEFLSIINKYEISPQKIKVEITERIISNNPSQVISIMETLRKEGIEFYLDDFGIGYSNLSRISKLPFECIKIDSSLIEMLDSEESIELFKAIIFAIKSTGKKVLFEGIETEEHLKSVAKLELDMIQGFFYSRPLSEIEYVDFLNDRSQR